MSGNKQYSQFVCRPLALACLTLVLSAPLAASPGISSKQCEDEARSDYEKIYCQILARGKAQALPGFFDFKRNSPAVQCGLLRAPARQLGIDLPALPSAPKPASSAPVAPPSSPQSATTPGMSAPGEPTTAAPSPRDVPPAEADDSEFALLALGDCGLDKDQIRCGHARYFLTINIPLKRLDPTALSEDNRLQFREINEGETLRDYLASLYPDYIDKMLYLGLGDSTLSFTKFHAIYEESLNQGEDFVARFGQMYELLKNERRSMHIQTRYQDNYPESIAQCMPLTDELIVCDNVLQNWVYRKMRE